MVISLITKIYIIARSIREYKGRSDQIERENGNSFTLGSLFQSFPILVDLTLVGLLIHH